MPTTITRRSTASRSSSSGPTTTQQGVRIHQEEEETPEEFRNRHCRLHPQHHVRRGGGQEV